MTMTSLLKRFFAALSAGAPVFAAILGVSAPAAAQVSNLDTIVVTSSRSDETLREVTTNITLIEAEDVENSSAETLQEILAQSGVAVEKSVGSLSTVSIRGFATDNHGLDLGSHVLVLLNGRRLGTGNASMISLANVDRIEILRGPAAVQYGTAAMGGVVNVITKNGKDSPFGMSLRASGGTFDSYKASGKVIGSVKDFDFSAGLSRTQYGSYKTGSGLPYNNSDYSNLSGSGEFGYSFLDGLHRIALNANFYDSPDSGSPGAFKENGVQNTTRTNKYNYSFGLDYAGKTANDKWSWVARYSYGQDYRGYNYTVATRNTWNKVAARTGQAQLEYGGDFAELIGGFDYLNYDITQSPNSNTTPNSVYGNMAAFGLAKFRFLDDALVLSFGARYDIFDFEDDKTGLKVDKRNFSPSVGVAWLPVDFLKLRAHYSEAFAMPTPIQLTADYDSSNSGMHYTGNPNLKPETSDSYEVGFDVIGNRFMGSVSYFRSKTRDFIEYYRVIPNVETEFRNMDRAYRSGVEMSLSADIGALAGYDFVLKPTISLTHMFERKTRERSDTPYVYITGVADDVFSFGLRFASDAIGFSGNLKINYASDSREADGSIERKAYMVADLYLKKRLYRFNGGGDVSATLEVDNFTDETYYSSGSEASPFIMPGRKVIFGLSWEFS
ncbi:MAG: TonB-dependent receptor [Deltaproteobacteria bacterium]|jgi:vitamin B12 transporter|nr:TonB-dependent receptor [Deltaproteobacteria bacterium]